MSEQKHTPAPWRYDGIFYVFGPEMGMVCDFGDEAGSVCRIRGTGAGLPQEANARLIAAAPELLEACEAVADAIRQENTEKYVFEDDWNPEAHLEGITLTIRDARLVYAALARARGEVIR